MTAQDAIAFARAATAEPPDGAGQLAAAAARSPYSRWEVTIVDDNGYAVGHGIARPGRSGRQEPQPAGPACGALSARVNIKVTQPKPGWHVWTTPTGRTYLQEPWRYPA
ncbi:MAG: hypothetical protein ACRDP7_05875 [Trebonia sp.]